MVDTDFGRNVKQVKPFLGIMLIASVGLYVAYAIVASLSDVAEAMQPGQGVGVYGSLVLVEPEEPRYGSLVRYRSSVSGDTVSDAHTYITTICFQDDKVVYQYSAKQGVKFLLSDPLEPGFDWDGGAASCNASLIYRVPGGGQAQLYMLDSISYEVGTRT